MSASAREPHGLCAPLAASRNPGMVVTAMHQIRYRSLQSEKDLKLMVGLLACYSEDHNVDQEWLLLMGRCMDLDRSLPSEQRRFVALMMHHKECAGVVFDDEHQEGAQDVLLC